MTKAKFVYVSSFLIIAALSACENQEGQTQEESKEILAENRPEIISIDLSSTDSMSDAAAYDQNRLSFSDKGWAAYSIDVPESGRYRVTFSSLSYNDSTQVWLEDHVDNLDGRTYNTTSHMHVPGSGELERVHRDGSPLRAGNHKIKIQIPCRIQKDKLVS